MEEGKSNLAEVKERVSHFIGMKRRGRMDARTPPPQQFQELVGQGF